MGSYAQKEIGAVFPKDGAVNVNVGIIGWSANEGHVYDLYFGTTPDPELYKSGLQATEEKPVILKLNSTYYWKIAEKKDGKIVRTSKTFKFSTLPITLNSYQEYTPFIDPRDNKIYWTIRTGNQEWFAHNLDYDLKDQSWYYANLESNKVYGRLYSGKALTTNLAEICPAGWHVPTQQEWTDLINLIGGIKMAGQVMKEATDTYWRKSETKGNNKSGMTILPSGSRDSKPAFSNLGKYTFFWTSTPNREIKGSFYNIDSGFMRDYVKFDTGDPDWSYSIRCLKDK